MPQKKEEQFKVTDRRLFTAEGDLREDMAQEPAEAAPPKAFLPEEQPGPLPAVDPSSQLTDASVDIPPAPTAADQKEQADAYSKSTKQMDARVELSGHSARDLEMSFERFMASLYMSAMVQLGLMHESGGQPRVDLIGARQAIDTLGLIQQKTKGNLTSAEENFLQNVLYELRMAYVEVTNSLARPPQAPDLGSGMKGR